MKASAWRRERSSSADARAAPFQRIRFGSRVEILTSDSTATAPRLPGHARNGLLRATTDDLAVLTRPEREPLRREVHRLEQVRLPRAVPARDEDEPWLELELEPRIRAHVAERNLLHDQVVSLLALSLRAGSA